MKDTQQRYDMKMSSHRGHPGSSSAKNSHRNPLISNFEKKVSIGNVEKKVNIGNVKKIHMKTSKGQNRRNERGNKPVNLLPEMDGIRGIGVGKEDATPQELYAIGAVFDHIYRGGSPLNCISVFQKEVNRAPHKKPYGCGGFGCGMEEETTIMKKMVSADDDTLGTMEWTYNRSFGTYDRSFISRDSTFQSSLDEDRARAIRFASGRSHDESSQPWDEEHIRNIGMSPPRRKKGSKFRKHKSDGSVDKNKSDSRDIINSKVSSLDREGSILDEGARPENHHDNCEEQDDIMERIMTWSQLLVAVAKENAPIAVAAASKATSTAVTAAAAAAGATARTENTASYASSDLTSLVHMFRNTIAEGIPEETVASTTTLQAALSSLVRNYESQEEDDLYSSDDSYDVSISTPPRPLNSLAKAMRSIANKEPTRTYAVSEQDQVVGKYAATKPTSLRPLNEVSSSTHRGTESKTSASSVGATIESSETPPQQLRGETSSLSPISTDSLSPLKRYNIAAGLTTTSLSGISRSDTEGKASHRGDAASVTSPPRSKIPSSIRMAPKELFISPSRVSTSSSGASITHRRSLFRRRGSTDGTLSNASDKNQSTQNPVSKSSPSRRRHLPPVPPDMSPTTPSAASPSRKLYLSSDNDGTELSIIGYSEENGTDNVSVVTPDRSTAATIPSSSPKSLSGISIKKIFSFRERKSDNSSKDKDTTNANSPRRVDTQIFQLATADTRTDFFYEESVIAESMNNNENIIVTPLNVDSNANFTTDSMLFTESNQEASEYEVQSV
jgi:hypothetical protein